ncbi:hypothetical protein GA0070616_3965 [Micromonospora nigra]|uniref:DUF4352 domain-containing protein n=1 Tax=Micromonospora nigra TaxID=145857 RepID=A0A1C6SKC0_9ACTN|nr:hypothetical protein [Micromonospora nigra]SCL29867.1 hypothetical protein GA0070616_3965 [Micromonospora nigra]
MPASTRHHRALAVFVHCVGLLSALPLLPAAAPDLGTTPHPAAAPAPEPATPSAPPAVPVPPKEATTTKPSPVTVAVAPEGTPAPRYRIEVRNDGGSPVTATVRQELPPGAMATAITDGGRETSAGTSGASEVTWRLTLAPRSTTTLATAISTTAPDEPLTAPACAYSADGQQPLDCATATWSAATPARDDAPAPVWRRAPVLLGGSAAVLVVAGGALWSRRRRRRPVAAALAAGGPGTVYPRPENARPPRRRSPSVWLVVPVAASVLAGTVGAATWAATRQVAGVGPEAQPTSGAWQGTGVSGAVGVPLREAAFEFTVYRIACEPGDSARQCQATVGVRNVSPERQTWHGKLQRVYLPDGTWVSTDEQATRAANQGQDVFAAPLAAGSRLVLPLVFTVDGQPEQVELRSGVFSAGVRVDVP